MLKGLKDDEFEQHASEPDLKLMAALAQLDEQTFLHSKRVQKLALILGKEMGLTTQELSQLSVGSLFHDIGKKDIPLEILNKKDPLSHEEWDLIKEHPIYGWQYVESLDLNDGVKDIILNHHLWANGEGGYPTNKKTRPCFLTQITTVADVADAMNSHRAYRPALSIIACVDYLEANVGCRFNKDIVQEFKNIIDKHRRLEH